MTSDHVRQNRLNCITPDGGQNTEVGSTLKKEASHLKAFYLIYLDFVFLSDSNYNNKNKLNSDPI